MCVCVLVFLVFFFCSMKIEKKHQTAHLFFCFVILFCFVTVNENNKHIPQFDLDRLIQSIKQMVNGAPLMVACHRYKIHIHVVCVCVCV